MLRKILKLFTMHHELIAIKGDLENLKILNGKLLARMNETLVDEIIKDIHRSEFKVFSQFGDDGIIQFLINYLEIENRNFIEFGVQNYTESNTRFLLLNNNWKGLIFDSSEQNIQYIRQDRIYWLHELKAVCEFISKENINQLIKDNGFIGEIGLLHIDIDGNDYWVWDAIDVIRPDIVIMEYNSVFGWEHPWTIPYNNRFTRFSGHFSGLYFGASLLALCDLANVKGYSFIGCNSSGNNAYFIKNAKMRDLKQVSAQDGFVLSQFRDGRDKDGKLTYLSGEERLLQIKGLEVFNTRTKIIEMI
jgi:hypothetical protein